MKCPLLPLLVLGLLVNPLQAAVETTLSKSWRTVGAHWMVLYSAQLAGYEKARQAVLNAEEQLMTGGRTSLNAKESQVDDLFMQYKLGELAQGFRNADQNVAGMHFFKGKPLIDRSSVFKFLQQMPKGAVLHLHNSAAVSSKWVVQNMSYMPGMLRCTDAEGRSRLSFRRAPKLHKCTSQYVYVADERRSSIDPVLFDENLEKLFNLYTPVPEREYLNNS